MVNAQTNQVSWRLLVLLAVSWALAVFTRLSAMRLEGVDIPGLGASFAFSPVAWLIGVGLQLASSGQVFFARASGSRQAYFGVAFLLGFWSCALITIVAAFSKAVTVIVH